MCGESKTMKMVREQSIDVVVSGNVRNEIVDILNAYQVRTSGINIQMAIDLFLLGTIYGKRKEREKRK